MERYAFKYFLLVTLLVALAAVEFWKTSVPSAARNQEYSKAADASHQGKLSFLALGDSYTIGESVAPEDRWPEQLAIRMRKLGADVSDPVIIARTGWTTGDLLRAISEAKPAGNFTLVTLLIGVNNQFQGRPEAEYREQFTTILKKAIFLAGGDASRVLVLSIPDWGATPFGAQYDSRKIGTEIDQFNQINREESARARVVYVDVTAKSRGATTRPELMAFDALHYSGTGYAEWVDACVGPVMRAMGAK
jgi:lysophospholipase L1-like esterase